MRGLHDGMQLSWQNSAPCTLSEPVLTSTNPNKRAGQWQVSVQTGAQSALLYSAAIRKQNMLAGVENIAELSMQCLR